MIDEGMQWWEIVIQMWKSRRYPCHRQEEGNFSGIRQG